MIFNGVEILKMQFSRQVDLTFERFLDSWSAPNHQEQGQAMPYPGQDRFEADVPINVGA